jgi:hypothetical protein
MLVSLYFCSTPSFDSTFLATICIVIVLECMSTSYHIGYVVCSAPQRGGWRGNGRPANSSQSSGGRGQGKGRGQDRNHAPMSAAELDAELDKYHSQAMKEN